MHDIFSQTISSKLSLIITILRFGQIYWCFIVSIKKQCENSKHCKDSKKINKNNNYAN